jgi:phage terminase large subunit
LAEAKAKGRIGNVGLDPLMTARAFWDIGGTGAKADATAIWVAQFIGKGEVRVLDYYEAVGQPLATHLQWLRDRGWDKALCVLPHDGGNHEKVISVTYAGAIRDAGFETEPRTRRGEDAG